MSPNITDPKTVNAEDRSQARGFHWRAPFLMTGALAAGICLAIGHHAFYQSRHRREISSEHMHFAGWQVTEQQLNIAVGTTFAFLVKACLVFATSVAYIQLFFATLASGPFKINVLDDWYSALSDMISLARSIKIYRHLILTLLAAIVWLLPIAAIVSPASLSVIFDHVDGTADSFQRPPLPAFTSLQLADLSVNSGSADEVSLRYWRPQNEVLSTVLAAATGGSILPIPSLGINSSWTLSTDLPRLRCIDMPQLLRDSTRLNFAFFVNTSMHHTSKVGPHYDAIPPYLAWPDPSVPHANDLNSIPYRLSDSTGYWGVDRTDVFMTPTMGILISATPDNWYPESKDCCNYGEGCCTVNMTIIDEIIAHTTLMQCKIWKSKYALRFRYSGEDQAQQIDVLTIDDKEELSISVLRPLSMQNASVSVEESFDSTSDASQSMFLWSSMALKDALFPLLMGSYHYATTPIDTQILSTPLRNTRELRALATSNTDLFNLSDVTDAENFGSRGSLFPPNYKTTDTPLSTALEELFFNVTISLASSNLLRYRASNPFGPAEVQVTFDRWGNIYSYAKNKLWLAYGIAIGVTAMNVVIGWLIMIRTRSSYTANFSTIVRIAKNSHFGSDLYEPRLPGRDPLPKAIGEAKMKIGVQDGTMRDNQEVAVLRTTEEVVDESKHFSKTRNTW